MATLTGTAEAVADLLAARAAAGGAEVLGPVPAADEQERMLVRVPRSAAAGAGPGAARGGGGAQRPKAAAPVRVQVDPADLF